MVSAVRGPGRWPLRQPSPEPHSSGGRSGTPPVTAQREHPAPGGAHLSSAPIGIVTETLPLRGVLRSASSCVRRTPRRIPPAGRVKALRPSGRPTTGRVVISRGRFSCERPRASGVPSYGVAAPWPAARVPPPVRTGTRPGGAVARRRTPRSFGLSDRVAPGGPRRHLSARSRLRRRMPCSLRTHGCCVAAEWCRPWWAGSVQPCDPLRSARSACPPVPARCALGAAEVRLHRVPGRGGGRPGGGPGRTPPVRTVRRSPFGGFDTTGWGAGCPAARQ